MISFCVWIVLFSLLVPFSSSLRARSSGSVVKPEYLRGGNRRFYFNSCECGFTGSQISSRRGKREVTEEDDLPRAMNVSFNIKLSINLNGDSPNVSVVQVNQEPSIDTDDLDLFSDEDELSKEDSEDDGVANLQTVYRTINSNISENEKPMVRVRKLNDLDQIEADQKEQDRIINGVEAKPGDAPWQVLLENMNDGEICGGSVINRRFILTAAHCTESFKRNGDKPVSFPRNILGLSFRCVYPDLLYNQMTYTAVVRQPSRCSGKLLSNKYKYVISAVHDHPRYRRLPNNELVFDFALLKTREDMSPFGTDLRPVCLPPTRFWDRTFDGKFVKISGYGRTTREQISGRDTTACKLMLATSQIYSASDRKCNMLSSHPSEQVCAWDAQSDACSGDSGGPMTLEDFDLVRNSILLGVVSYGSSVCAHEQAAGIYGRVTRVMKWILTKIQSGECANM